MPSFPITPPLRYSITPGPMLNNVSINRIDMSLRKESVVLGCVARVPFVRLPDTLFK